MIQDQVQVTTSPRRLANAAVRLLDASEAAATRGSAEFARTYALKAAQATRALHELALDAVHDLVVRRVAKAESQYGRIS